jgi:phosphate transport system protein
MARSSFQKELTEVQGSLLNLEGLAEKMLSDAVESLKSRNPALAQAVIDSDDAVDNASEQIEQQVVKVIALHQPVASDLRHMIAAIHNTIDLERVADLAVDIAEQVPELSSLPLLKPLIDIPRMTQISQEMLHDALDALRDDDIPKARAVCLRDQEVDDLFIQILRELIGFMIEDPRTVNRAVPLLFIARSLERVADHATNLAEMVMYQVDGKRITCKAIEAEARAKAD